MTTPRHGLALLSVGTTLYAIDGTLAAGHTHSTNLNEALNLSSFANTTVGLERVAVGADGAATGWFDGLERDVVDIGRSDDGRCVNREGRGL